VNKRVIVLYEDSRGVRARSFGPHELTLMLVADARGEAYANHDLRARVRDVPEKGRDNLLIRCSMLERKLPGRQVVALLDDDRIRESGLLRVRPPPCRKAVVRAIKELSDAPERLHIVLLDHNMEHVLRELQAIGFIPRERIERAIQKDLLQRDLALLAVARARRHLRDELVQRVPSLGRLRDTIVRLLQD
jgi:hypothetical protein